MYSTDSNVTETPISLKPNWVAILEDRIENLFGKTGATEAAIFLVPDSSTFDVVLCENVADAADAKLQGILTAAKQAGYLGDGLIKVDGTPKTSIVVAFMDKPLTNWTKSQKGDKKVSVTSHGWLIHKVSAHIGWVPFNPGDVTVKAALAPVTGDTPPAAVEVKQNPLEGPNNDKEG